MGHQSGAKTKIVIGFEPTYGTLPTDGFLMPFISCTVGGTRNQGESAVIRDSLNPSEPYDGNENVAGQVIIPIDSIAMWYWLKAMFGDPTTTGASSPFVHEFEAGNSDRPSLTIEKQFPDLDTAMYFQNKGCKITGFSISIGGDGELQGVLSVIGSEEVQSETPFDSSPTTVTQAKLKNNQAALQEGGSTYADAKLLDLNFNLPVDEDTFCIGGGGSRGSAPDKTLGISAKLDCLFKDVSLLTKAENSTESSLQVTMTGSSSSILDILLPEVKYAKTSPPIDGPQGLVVSLTGGAYYDDASEGTSAVVTLTNTEEHAS